MKKIIAFLSLTIFLFSSCNFFKKDPQKAVNGGIRKFVEVKKMSSSTKISGIIKAPPGEKPQSIQFSLHTTGKMDSSDEKFSKVDGSFTVDATLDTQKISGEVLLKIFEKNVYLNLKKFEIPGEGGEKLKTELASFLGTWWSLPMGSENLFAKLTIEQKELQEKLKTAHFFINAKEEGIEEIGGVKSTRYRVDLDKQALQTFLGEALRLTSKTQITSGEERALVEGLKDIEFSGAVWVGSDGFLHRIRGTLALQPKQGVSGSFEIEYTAWDYGKKVEVVKPESVKEFNPIMILPLLGILGSQAVDSSSGALPDETMGAKQITPPASTGGKLPVKKK